MNVVLCSSVVMSRIVYLICFPLLSLSACPLGQFKWGTEGQCTSCPGSSYATVRGASVCACRSGYLRAQSDAPDTPCTSKCRGKESLHLLVFFFTISATVPLFL